MRIILGDNTLASYPQGGGHWMVFLQYLLGLDALGHDVFLWEQMPGTSDAERDAEHVRSFFGRLEEFGFKDRCALIVFPENAPESNTLENATIHGRSTSQLKEIARDADILWNFCSALRQPMLSLFARRAFIDLDPGHLQVSALMCDMQIAEHHFFLTVGSKARDPDCEVPSL